jgi:hypothetical protein
MGKKSLIKSTTKKKKESGKTTAKASKKGSATKAAPPDTAEPVIAEPLAVSPEIPADPRGLLFRHFPSLEWPKVTVPAPSMAHIEPPPFVSTDDPAEADRIRDMLLNRRHTMAEIQAVAEPPEPVVEAPAPVIPIDPREVLFRHFPSPEWAKVTVPAPSMAHIETPPFVSTDDPAEADRIRDMLLNRRHTMAEIQAVAEPPEPVVEAPAPVIPIDPREVLFRHFPSLEWPKVTVPAPSMAHIEPPPFVSTDDPAEADRIRDMLLFRRHTMAEIQAVAEPPEPSVVVDVSVEEKPVATSQPTESLALTDRTGTMAVTEPEATQALITQTAPVSESAPPPIAQEPADPMLRYAKYAALGFALLILVLIGASYVNSTTCYLHVNNGATELWEGRFSPMGKTLATTLNGFTPPDPARTQYKRNELYPAVFNHYLNLADDMATSAATPDFRTIHAFLTKARAFAVDEASRNAVGVRLNSLGLMTLLYKADVAVSTGGEESLATAAELLTEAQKIATDQSQMEMIKRKLDNVNVLATELKTRATTPDSEAEAATLEPAMAPQAE